MRQLIHNSVTCLECGETLVSTHVHDYKTCSCPQQTMVDGGNSYGRSGGKDLEKVQTNYIYSDDKQKTVRKYLKRGTRGISGQEPYREVFLKDIDDEWLQAIIDYEERLRPDNIYLPIYRKEQKYRLKKLKKS